jgi:hypothetical protein
LIPLGIELRLAVVFETAMDDSSSAGYYDLMMSSVRDISCLAVFTTSTLFW